MLGWWGLPGFVGVPIVLLWNWAEARNLKALTMPRYNPGSGGFSVSGTGQASRQDRPPFSPGKPLLRRWTMYIPPAVFAAAILAFSLWIVSQHAG